MALPRDHVRSFHHLEMVESLVRRRNSSNPVAVRNRTAVLVEDDSRFLLNEPANRHEIHVEIRNE